MGVALGHRLSLSIAGLTFAVSSDDLPLYEDSARTLSLFHADDGPGTVPVEIREAVPGTRHGGVIFDAGSYLVCASGSDREIIFNPSARRDALWRASMSLQSNRIDVFAGEGLRRRVNGAEVRENPFRYPLDQLAVIYLLRGQGLVVHAAGAEMGGRAWLFAGVSGAGKTTLARLLQGSSGAGLLSDDRIVVKGSLSGYEAWGTPWPGEAGIAVNRSAPLGGIFFLVKDTATALRPLEAAEGARRLAPLVSVPWYDRELLDGWLDFTDRLSAGTSFAELRFSADEEAAGVIAGVCGA